MDIQDFAGLRYGMFVHYGLFSMLGRGEWVMNREKIPPQEMEEIARRFNPANRRLSRLYAQTRRSVSPIPRYVRD